MDNQPASSIAPVTAPDAKLHCPSCGYNLTGLTSDKCPECGHSVTLVSKGLVWPQTAATVALVCCRLLAIYILFLGLIGIVADVLTVIGLAVNAGNSPVGWPVAIAGGFVYRIGHFLAGGLLWWTGPWLSRRMIHPYPKPQMSVPMDGRMLLTAGCVVVGLLGLAHGLDEAVVVALYPRPVTMNPIVSIDDYFRSRASLISAGVQMALGLWLIFGSKSLVRAIIYLRGLGPTAEEKK